MSALIDMRLLAHDSDDMTGTYVPREDIRKGTWSVQGASLPGVPLILSGCGSRGMCWALTPSPIDTEDLHVEMIQADHEVEGEGHKETQTVGNSRSHKDDPVFSHAGPDTNDTAYQLEMTRFTSIRYEVGMTPAP